MSHPIKPVMIAVAESDLNPYATKIMLTLCSIASPDRLVWPGRRWLAAHTGISPTTTWNQLRMLCARGWLVETGQKRNLAKVYRIEIPMPSPGAGLPRRLDGWTSGSMKPAEPTQ